jgi:hypothetical protein
MEGGLLARLNHRPAAITRILAPFSQPKKRRAAWLGQGFRHTERQFRTRRNREVYFQVRLVLESVLARG